MSNTLRNKHVFINCPFDSGYRPLFDGIVFAIYALGFTARCSLEEDDGSEFRLAKIGRIIEQCKFGVHDLSAVALDTVTGLPRFNMPLELGLFLGCRQFGEQSQRKKTCLILDSDPFRYRNFISDISGQDIHAHGAVTRRAIIEIRNWLAITSRSKSLPGGAEIADRFDRFLNDLPSLCASLKLDPQNLIFIDLSQLISTWLRNDR